MNDPHPARTPLDRHQARRGRGVPTVSVLAGPPGLGLREWRGWALARGRGVAAAGPPAAARGWVAAAFAAADPVALAAAWVGRLTGTVPDPGRLTRYDLDRLWPTLPVGPADPAAAAAYLALAGGPIDPDRFVNEMGDPARVFAGVCGLAPDAGWPALVLTDPGTPSAFIDAVRWLEKVAAVVPGLPVGVCAPAAVLDAALAAAAGTRAAALAREGLIPVPEVTADDLGRQLRAAGVDPLPPPPTVARLTAGGLAPDVAAAFVGAAKAVRAAAADPAEFRSAVEEFLFEQFESLPETAGLFRPNRPLPFDHGPRPAEADLLADGLKIVVEIDGSYYHLTTPQYRRDRRKDWFYQRHGYLVLRFLAEDVVDDLELIVTTVLDAVALRRASPPPGGARP